MAGTIDMDLITTGVSASERLRRENVLTATRNLILDKMQHGGPTKHLSEVKSIFYYYLFQIKIIRQSFQMLNQHSECSC